MKVGSKLNVLSVRLKKVVRGMLFGQSAILLARWKAVMRRRGFGV